MANQRPDPIYLFYSTRCEYCKNFFELIKKNNVNPNIFQVISIEQNPELIIPNMSTVPAIVFNKQLFEGEYAFNWLITILNQQNAQRSAMIPNQPPRGAPQDTEQKANIQQEQLGQPGEPIGFSEYNTKYSGLSFTQTTSLGEDTPNTSEKSIYSPSKFSGNSPYTDYSDEIKHSNISDSLSAEDKAKLNFQPHPSQQRTGQTTAAPSNQSPHGVAVGAAPMGVIGGQQPPGGVAPPLGGGLVGGNISQPPSINYNNNDSETLEQKMQKLQQSRGAVA